MQEVSNEQNSANLKTQKTYIPFRYVFAIIITIFEISLIIGFVLALCIYVPYFYFLTWVIEIICVIKILSSSENADYKIPWLLIVLILPVAGFMLYLIFSSRTLKKKYVKRLNSIKRYYYEKNDDEEFSRLKKEDATAYANAKLLCTISKSHLFCNTKQKYFALGEDYYKSLLTDISSAQKFIYMEYFIIKEGEFWDSILKILIEKAKSGVEIKLIYDDMGCMTCLPSKYYKQLKSHGINAMPFSRMKGKADSEFNNRSHRKITIIDGYIGYTGGLNVADEYINKINRFGHWKDGGIRLEGQAVWELTKLFISDFALSVKKMPKVCDDLYPACSITEKGYVLPFGDGPNPIYNHRVGKTAIQNLLNGALKYVYITTPYLVLDDELCITIENTALRGVEVKIILPHIPDKKLIFGIAKSFYPRLIKAGVKILEYERGFMHNKSYLADGKTAIIGSINLDYRSLVHHFENGVWLYKTQAVKDLKKDFDKTLLKCLPATIDRKNAGCFRKFFNCILKIFSPLL